MNGLKIIQDHIREINNHQMRNNSIVKTIHPHQLMPEDGIEARINLNRITYVIQDNNIYALGIDCPNWSRPLKDEELPNIGPVHKVKVAILNIEWWELDKRIDD